jgi:hypothetical protein
LSKKLKFGIELILQTSLLRFPHYCQPNLLVPSSQFFGDVQRTLQIAPRRGLPRLE